MAYVKTTLLLLLISSGVRAQSFSEWFRQKSTQKKYLTQQIAALQVYSGYLSKGYRIAKGGLGSIGGYVGREFDLHGVYYDRLDHAGIAVKSDPQAAEILRWQSDIISQSEKIRKVAGLNSNEKDYVGKVCKALLDDCEARLNDLGVILGDHKTKMSDEERIRHLGRLHQAMQDNYRFSANFLVQLQLYVKNKSQEKQDVNSLNQLYANQ